MANCAEKSDTLQLASVVNRLHFHADATRCARHLDQLGAETYQVFARAAARCRSLQGSRLALKPSEPWLSLDQPVETAAAQEPHRYCRKAALAAAYRRAMALSGALTVTALVRSAKRAPIHSESERLEAAALTRYVPVASTMSVPELSSSAESSAEQMSDTTSSG